ncbi:hypothetical protein ES705_48562 [subsurface metagenome]
MEMRQIRSITMFFFSSTFLRLCSAVSETVKAIRPIIPIKIEEIQIAIKIPAAYTGRVYEIKNNYAVTKEEWQEDGSFIALLRVPAGMRDELFSFLNAITKGEVQTKVVK